MKYLTRMLAFTRLLVLRRQWKQIKQWLFLLSAEQESVLSALVYGEAQRAAKHPLPQFYASEHVESYSPWGTAVDAAFEKTRTDNPQVQMRGVAVWLAVVYHETRNAPLEPLRKVLTELLMQYVMRHPQYMQVPNLATMGYIHIHGGTFTVIRHLADPTPPMSFEELADGLADMVSYCAEGGLRDRAAGLR